MNAPNTGTTLTTAGSNVNKTSVAISTNIIIMVGNQPVGAVQELRISEKRDVKQIDEVGTDGHVDSVPNKSADITGTCTRVRLDRLRIAEAFSRGFLHVAAQVYPFDIVILDKQKRDQGSQISTVIKNVWITGIDYTYSSDNWVITDTMSWAAENIFSILNNGSNQSAAVGGELGIKHIGGGVNGTVPLISGDGIQNIEQLSDSGANGRRGSFDASGLIDLSDSGALF